MEILTQKFKNNPMVSSLALLVTLGVLGTGVATVINDIDRLWMTEAEHTADIQPLNEKVETIRRWQKCDRLDRRISQLEDRRWYVETSSTISSEAKTELLRPINEDIAQARRSFNSLGCGTVLADDR